MTASTIAPVSCLVISNGLWPVALPFLGGLGLFLPCGSGECDLPNLLELLSPELEYRSSWDPLPAPTLFVLHLRFPSSLFLLSLDFYNTLGASRSAIIELPIMNVWSCKQGTWFCVQQSMAPLHQPFSATKGCKTGHIQKLSEGETHGYTCHYDRIGAGHLSMPLHLELATQQQKEHAYGMADDSGGMGGSGQCWRHG